MSDSAADERLEHPGAPSGTDPIHYKNTQHELCDNTAAGYRKWWQTIEKSTNQANERSMKLAQVRNGQRVLDMATGIGETALTAARLVGTTGRVVATDLSPKMLEIAQERATALRLTNVEFQQADTEELKYSEHSFDVVLCRFGLMFLPNLASTLRTIWHLFVPQAKFAAAVWDIPVDGCPSKLAFQIAQEMFQLPSPSPSTPASYGLAYGVLERMMIDTGFVSVHPETMPVAQEWQTTEACQQCMRDIVPPLGLLVGKQPPERQTEFWLAFGGAVHKFADSEGRLRITNTAECVVGQR
jgi:ubiquinone/menaquinone biosynthesis C-methylase UbiE